ncbi:MAG: outer membrane lipoprotein carrier protein LolA [Treponema sp.]|nr:outer membrane lipoprotein carrier protein LolA [Treponema sp.]
MINKKSVFTVIFISVFITITYAQESILTAADFFKGISEYYGTIKEYEADMKIQAGKNFMEGRVSFKRPNLLRIDFSDPETQVLVFNGDILTIYLPGPQATLNQSVQSEGSGMSGANLATPLGLQLMSRYYTISYLSGQEPVPINEEDSASEKVIKLVLTRRTTSEGFEKIFLSINPTSKLIRRVEATSVTGQSFKFDFSGYLLNNNIPDTRFIYDAPSSANKYNNFFYSE